MYFFIAFKMALRNRLHKKSSILFLLMAVLLTVTAVFWPSAEEDNKIRVGVVTPDAGAEVLLELMQERSFSLVEYVVTDENTVDQKILSGAFDCGVVLPEDFSERLQEMDVRRLITFKTGPASTVYPIIQECLAACMMELMNPYIVQGYLQEKDLDPSAAANYFQKWDLEDCWIQISLETAGGKALDPVSLRENSHHRILLGLVAIFTMVWGLYLTVDLGSWLKDPAVQRMRTVRPVTQLLMPQLSASMLPVLMWGSLMVLIMGLPITSIIGYCFLVVYVLSMGLVISRFEVLFQSVIAVIPFVVIGIFLLEPVLMDIHLLFPGIEAVTQFFPVSLFLRTGNGSWGAVVLLALEAGVLAGSSLILDHREATVSRTR